MHMGVGVMAARRNGVDHPRRDAAADKPVVAEVGERDAVQALFDQIEALIEAVAAEFDVIGPVIIRPERIARTHDIEAAERERVDAELER
jgi:hypothetical protein